LTVTKGKDLEALEGSGIIGLSPAPSDKSEIENKNLTEIPGFIAQLRESQGYNARFQQMFSVYLSNDQMSPGDISFGGYDLFRFAKPGHKISWHDLGSNNNYWCI